MAEPSTDQAEDAQPPTTEEETAPDCDQAAACDTATAPTPSEAAADDDASAPAAPSFAGFKMSSRRRVVLVPSSAAVAADERDAAGDGAAAQLVTALEDKKLQGADGATLDKKAGPLVIPMLATNDWRVARTKPSAPTDKRDAEPGKVNQSQDGVTAVANGADLAQQAKAELLREARGEQPDEHETVVSAIPMLMRNRVPDGYESDEKFDVSLRPDESALSDYDSVPITDFGLAMLRGMGWSDGAPIGRTNKRVVAAKIPELRPKGLGLGADKALAAHANGARRGAGAGGDKKQEQLKMVPGANVMLSSGKNAGMYGRVDSLDEDNSRAVVTLAIGGAAVSCSQFNLRLVDKETYDKFAKCINVDKYAEYTMKRVREQEAANGSVASSDNSDAGGGARHKKRKKEKRRPPSVEPIDSPSTSTRVWPRRDMRVRVVDSASKRFRHKVRVVDAGSADCCTCRADDGTVIVLPQRHLETVVPRGQDALVLVFKPAGAGSKGSRGGGARLGRLVEADRRACVATVQYATGSRRCERVDFDHLCEFVGNPDEYDD